MSELIKRRMEEINVNTHQLSCSCGIPHGYLNSLLSGLIQKPGRDKIIQIGVSLYWGIDEINKLLKTYGNEEISKKDITFFIKTVENKGVFSGPNPIYPGTINFAITIMSVERLRGDVKLVTAGYPHAIFAERSPNYEYDNEKDALYKYIDEFLFEERKNYFFQNIKKYRVTHLVCKKCLEEKINRDKAKIGRNLIQTFHRLFECILKENNYDFKLIESCPKFEFHLKKSINVDEKPITVFAGSLTEHYKSHDKSLVGFIHNSKEVYDIFLNEFKRLEKFTMDECTEKNRLIQHIVDILIQNGVGNMKDFSKF